MFSVGLLIVNRENTHTLFVQDEKKSHIRKSLILHGILLIIGVMVCSNGGQSKFKLGGTHVMYICIQHKETDNL